MPVANTPGYVVSGFFPLKALPERSEHLLVNPDTSKTNQSNANGFTSPSLPCVCTCVQITSDHVNDPTFFS